MLEMVKEALHNLNIMNDKIEQDCEKIIELTEELKELNLKMKGVINNLGTDK